MFGTEILAAAKCYRHKILHRTSSKTDIVILFHCRTNSSRNACKRQALPDLCTFFSLYKYWEER